MQEKSTSLVRSPSGVEGRIHLVRGLRVLMDEDLAVLYGVETRALLQAVRRNPRRFPPDFCFRISPAESRSLRSRTVISKGRGGRRTPRYVFTEQGVAMLSIVLRSERAMRMNVEIMRAFARLRRFLITQEDLARKVDELEGRYDAQCKVVFDALRALVAEEERPRERIGFRPEGEGGA